MWLWVPLLLEPARVTPTVVLGSIDYHALIPSYGLVSHGWGTLIYGLIVTIPLLLTPLCPGPCIDAYLYTVPPAPGTAAALPTNLEDALSAFAADTVLREALGEPFCQAYESFRRRHS